MLLRLKWLENEKFGKKSKCLSHLQFKLLYNNTLKLDFLDLCNHILFSQLKLAKLFLLFVYCNCLYCNFKLFKPIQEAI